ncbi:MAG TPA: 50S ribosomal protein L18 [Anaerolineae bacterium]|jgi:large subunit ribosomal protein L18|nr:50S ribosomal protein L18 [Anaerolineae bacterium]
MPTAPSRSAARQKRHSRLRLRVAGSAERPRLAVFRSINQIYAQVIDDSTGHTLVAASSMEASVKGAGGTKTERAKQVGSLIGERAKAAGVERVVFDRAGFKFHGRVRALAEGARESGLEF